jgi:hypothetical protein
MQLCCKLHIYGESMIIYIIVLPLCSYVCMHCSVCMHELFTSSKYVVSSDCINQWLIDNTKWWRIDWLSVCVMHTDTHHDQQNISTFKFLMRGVLKLWLSGEWSHVGCQLDSSETSVPVCQTAHCPFPGNLQVKILLVWSPSLEINWCFFFLYSTFFLTSSPGDQAV